MSMENILELQQVSKTFPKSNFTLENVTFSLPYGAILGFVGENGTLVVDRSGWEVIPEKVSGKARMEAVPLKKAYGEGGLNLHVKNHLECIKSRNRNCNASIEIGAHIAKFSQLGNIAYRTGKKLTWDGKSFHDAEADKYLCKEYRAPWELPKI